MTEPSDKKGSVGYRRPPTERQFAKGKSGNPLGRPPKTRQAKTRAVLDAQLEDILLAEAFRPIQIRENDQVVEMPMIQAVLRSMGVAAVKGSHKAQTTLANMVQAVQAKDRETLLKLMETVVKYKADWQATCEDYDHRGEPRPEPVPHPDEMVVDFNTGHVKFNGPMTQDAKAHWDKILARRQESLDAIAEMRKLMKRDKKLTKFCEGEIAHEQQMADMLGGMIPDEKTRREPGFDFEVWRARNDRLAELNKRRRKRRLAKP